MACGNTTRPGRPGGTDDLLHGDRDRHDRLAPVQIQYGPIRFDVGKIERERLQEGTGLRPYGDTECILRFTRIGDVEDVRSLAEDHGPLVGPGNGPDAVLPGREGLACHEHVPVDGDGRGLVRAGAPDLSPRDQTTEPLASRGRRAQAPGPGRRPRGRLSSRVPHHWVPQDANPRDLDFYHVSGAQR